MALRGSQLLAVDFDDVFNRIRLRSKLGDDVPVHADAAATNHFFSVPARGNACVGEDFLQSLLHDFNCN